MFRQNSSDSKPIEKGAAGQTDQHERRNISVENKASKNNEYYKEEERNFSSHSKNPWKKTHGDFYSSNSSGLKNTQNRKLSQSSGEATNPYAKGERKSYNSS
jgi:hypothetical protein